MSLRTGGCWPMPGLEGGGGVVQKRGRTSQNAVLGSFCAASCSSVQKVLLGWVVGRIKSPVVPDLCGFPGPCLPKV